MANMKETKTARITSIDAIKGLAIFCVISAHCNLLEMGQNVIADTGYLILSHIGTWGVGCFYFLAGILFRPNDNKLLFWQKKFKNLIVPWIISATAVYFYVRLRKPPIVFTDWIYFIVGIGSYCYYMTVLMIIFALYLFLKVYRYQKLQYIFMAITFTSVLFFPDFLAPTSCCNVLNWIGFFALGYSIGKAGLEKFEHFATGKVWRWLIYFITLSVLVFNVLRNQEGNYFGYGALSAVCGNVCIATLGVNLANKKMVAMIGKDSYFIYIWHMPLAGIIARLTFYSPLSMFIYIRPFIVLACVECAALAAKKIIPQKYQFLVGISN